MRVLGCRPSFGLSLFLTILPVWIGCNSTLVAQEDAGDTDDPGDPGGLDLEGGGTFDDPTPADVVTKRAFHMLQRTDIVSPTWPAGYEEFDVFVCNATIDRLLIDKVRNDVPGSLCLASVSNQDFPWGLHPNNPYWQEFESRIDPALFVTNLDTGEPVLLYGATEPNAPGHPAFVQRPEVADILVDFHEDYTLHGGFDGVYIDMCNRDWPRWKTERLLERAPRFDIDNDGTADTIGELQTMYDLGRPYFTERLRAVFGDNAVIVGNSGGPLWDPSLSGITVEQVGRRYSVEEALSIFRGNRQHSNFPGFSIAWTVYEAQLDPIRELTEGFDWIHFGIVRGYDF